LIAIQESLDNKTIGTVSLGYESSGVGSCMLKVSTTTNRS